MFHQTKSCNHILRRKVLAAVGIVSLAASTSRSAEITSTWVGAISNRWGNASNWDPVGVPNNGGGNTFQVVIDANEGASVNVVLDFGPVVVDTLTLDTGDKLTIAPAGFLQMASGLIDLNGTIEMNPLNQFPLARLFFLGDTLIQGTGDIHMLGQPGRCLIASIGTAIVTIGLPGVSDAGNPTIHGRGVNDMNYVNNGTLVADFPNDFFINFGETQTNNSLIQSTLGTHSIDQTFLVQGPNGSLEVISTNQFMGINTSTIVNGAMRNGLFRFFQGLGPTNLNNVNMSDATFSIEEGIDLNINGGTAQNSWFTFTDDGTATISGGFSGAGIDLDTGGSGTFTFDGVGLTDSALTGAVQSDLDGFYIQTDFTMTDVNTSDGIMIFSGDASVQADTSTFTNTSMQGEAGSNLSFTDPTFNSVTTFSTSGNFVMFLDGSEVGFNNSDFDGLDVVLADGAQTDWTDSFFANGTVTGSEGAAATVTDSTFDNMTMTSSFEETWSMLLDGSEVGFINSDVDGLDVVLAGGAQLDWADTDVSNLTVTGGDGAAMFWDDINAVNNTEFDGLDVVLADGAQSDWTDTAISNATVTGGDDASLHWFNGELDAVTVSSAGAFGVTMFWDGGANAVNNSDFDGLDVVLADGAQTDWTDSVVSNSTITSGDGASANWTNGTINNSDIDGLVVLFDDGLMAWTNNSVSNGSEVSLGANVSFDGTDTLWFGSNLYLDDGAVAIMTNVTLSGSSFSGDPDSDTDRIIFEGAVNLEGDNTLQNTTVDVQEPLNLVATAGTTTINMEDVSWIDTNGNGQVTGDSGIDFVFFSGDNMADVPMTLDGDLRVTGAGTTVNASADTTADRQIVQQSGELHLRTLILQGSFFLLDDAGKLRMEETSASVLKYMASQQASLEVDSGLNDGSPSVVSIEQSFSFEQIDETSWFWGPQSTLALTGGIGTPPGQWALWTALEVGGTDVGTDPDNHTGDPAGFDNNFDLSILRIDPGAHAYLTDSFDNDNRNGAFGESEALFVDTLEFADGDGLLNLNGLHLYFDNLIGDAAQIIDVAVIASDCDGDGDADSFDFGAFQVCMTGPGGGPVAPECLCADLDGDGDVDFGDFRLFQLIFTGS